MVERRGGQVGGQPGLGGVLGLAGLVFALIEGQRYGWITPISDFHAGPWTWPRRRPRTLLTMWCTCA